jgi:hypothetical protein
MFPSNANIALAALLLLLKVALANDTGENGTSPWPMCDGSASSETEVATKALVPAVRWHIIVFAAARVELLASDSSATPGALSATGGVASTMDGAVGVFSPLHATVSATEPARSSVPPRRGALRRQK